MLVYANIIPVRSTSGLRDPLSPVADWLAVKLRRKVRVDDLLSDWESPSKEGWQVKSNATIDTYPHLAAVELVHPDSAVTGRRWHTEIGLRQLSANSDVELTILVQTSEIRSRVTETVKASAPRFVSDILKRCKLSSAAVGGSVKTLGDGDAEAFRYEVQLSSRRYPLVVVSCAPNGEYLIDTELLTELLIGIAEIVVIPPTADTFWLARAVGEEFIPYRGGVKIIYPVRSAGRSHVTTFRPDNLVDISSERRAVAREIFSVVLHRTNVPLSWRHVGLSAVREDKLRRELASRRAAAVKSGDTAAYIESLEKWVAEEESKVLAVAEQRQKLSDELETAQFNNELQVQELQSTISALKHHLKSKTSDDDDSPYARPSSLAVASLVSECIRREPTPEQCLLLLEHFFADRVRVLPSAWSSSRNSEEFKYGAKLFGLLLSLATDYWSALTDGKPDQEARKVFGNAYAAKESESVVNNKTGKTRRTFIYKSEEYVMVKHLKLGVKDSATECIRVHFEWLAAEKIVIIGHCGPHIDFN